MGLLTVPADFTASTLTPTQLNTLKNTIYNDYGTTTNLQGNIVDANVSLTAGIQRTKTADTSVVCGNTTSPGTQTISRPTAFVGGALSIQSASIAGNAETVASAAALAINPNVLYHFITGTSTIGTMTGATNEGTIAILIFNGSVIITNGTTDVLNTLHNNAYVSGTGPANFAAVTATAMSPSSKKYVYTKLNGAYTNLQWVEVPT